MQDVLEKIKACGFECEAGPLEMSEDFQRLSKAVSYLPEYPMGSAVDVHLKVTVEGQDFEKWVAGVITKVTTKYTDSGSIFHMYQVSAGIPQQWHSPKLIASYVSEIALRKRPARPEIRHKRTDLMETSE